MKNNSAFLGPKLSVCVITYNQAQFIEDTLEGILTQETDFDFEVIISDDHSTDDTSTIVNNYIQKHSKGNKINYIKHEENLGVTKNFFWSLAQCKGAYIALCEGDDFWLDPSKLQKQVDFLEENPSVVLTYHPFVNVDSRKDEVNFRNNINNLINEGKIKNTPRTATLVFRNKILQRNLTIFNEAPNADSALRFFLKDYGKFKFLNNIYPAVRRINFNSIMGSLSMEDKLPLRIKTHSVLYEQYKNTSREKEAAMQLAKFKLMSSVYKIRKLSFLKGCPVFLKGLFYAIKNHMLKYYLVMLLKGTKGNS